MRIVESATPARLVFFCALRLYSPEQFIHAHSLEASTAKQSNAIPTTTNKRLTFGLCIGFDSFHQFKWDSLHSVLIFSMCEPFEELPENSVMHMAEGVAVAVRYSTNSRFGRMHKPSALGLKPWQVLLPFRACFEVNRFIDSYRQPT